MTSSVDTVDINIYDKRIVFYPKSHQYKLALGEKKSEWKTIDSVSRICGVVDKSEALLIWASRLCSEYLLSLPVKSRTDDEVKIAVNKHREKKEEAATTWTMAHEWCENYIKTWDISFPDDPEVVSCVSAFMDWVNLTDIKWVASERFIYSNLYNYVGICDAIAEIDGKTVLIDFKTSNRIRKLEYGMQTSAYAKAYEEETWVHIDRILVIRFPKEPTGDESVAEFYEVEDVDHMFDLFLSAQKLLQGKRQYD